MSQSEETTSPVNDLEEKAFKQGESVWVEEGFPGGLPGDQRWASRNRVQNTSP